MLNDPCAETWGTTPDSKNGGRPPKKENDMTAKAKLPRAVPGTAAPRPNGREAWRIFGIMAEFVEATERLSQIRPAVSIFGSARIAPDHMYYILTEQIARKLSDAGFAVVSGGGP